MEDLGHPLVVAAASGRVIDRRLYNNPILRKLAMPVPVNNSGPDAAGSLNPGRAMNTVTAMPPTRAQVPLSQVATL
jgi:hypothetical protein